VSPVSLSNKLYLSLLIICCSLSACSWSTINPQTPTSSTRSVPSQNSIPSTNHNNGPTPHNPSNNSPSVAVTPRSTNHTELLLQVLQRQIGRPYLYGGNSPSGFDCSGLVQYSFAQVGVNLPRSTQAQMSTLPSIKREQLQAGDLAFFQTGNNQYHVAVMTDSQNFIHAPSSGKSVSTSSFANPYWQQTFIGARRYQQ